MYNRDMIFKQLQDMNAPRNSVVHMHISLKSVGEIEGRGEGLLDILIDYFTGEGGLLCVPAHTWKNLADISKPTLDFNISETSIGKFPQLAIEDKRGVRTMHPTHSIVVFGNEKRVEEFVKHDDNTNTSTSPDGCYGQIYKDGGKILLIGIGHEKNTFIHCVEEMLDVPDRLEKTSVQVQIKKEDGEIISRELYSHIRGLGISDYYPKYEKAFRMHNCITDGFIGDAKVQLCDAEGIKNVVEMIYKNSGGIEVLKNDKEIDESFYMEKRK